MPVAAISVSGCLERGIEPLMRAHWREFEADAPAEQMRPNAAAYRQLEDQDALIAFGAFDGDEMVGYSVSILVPHLHSQRLQAMNNAIFLERHHRGRLGLQLIRETERVGRERGAAEMLWQARSGTALDHLLPRLGYRGEFTIYQKDL